MKDSYQLLPSTLEALGEQFHIGNLEPIIPIFQPRYRMECKWEHAKYISEAQYGDKRRLYQDFAKWKEAAIKYCERDSVALY